MNKFWIIIVLLTYSLVSATSVELINGRNIEGKLLKALENEIYLEVDQSLIIINKKYILEPTKYLSLSFIENENHKINFNSYIIVNIDSKEDLNMQINKEINLNSNSKNNFTYVELLGSGILYSINFEKRIYKNYFVKLGATTWQVNNDTFGSSILVTIFPIALLRTFGKGPVKFELGGGISYVDVSNFSSFTFSSNINSNKNIIGNASAIVRFEPYPYPLIFKIGCSSLIIEDEFKPWPSVSAGFCF